MSVDSKVSSELHDHWSSSFIFQMLAECLKVRNVAVVKNNKPGVQVETVPDSLQNILVGMVMRYIHAIYVKL